MASKPLDGQTALVTGAGRRIGRATALRLASDGARVVVHYRSSESDAREVVAEIVRSGGAAHAIRADLSRLDEIDRLFAETESQFGGLDILINSAALFYPTPIGEVTETQWDAMLDSNVKAMFFCAQRAAPLLRITKRGRIVNFAGGLLAWPQYIAYGVSKAGVIMLTRTLARALAPEITVNAIAPGTISFPDDAPELAETFVRQAPLARTGTAEDIVNAVSYLIAAPFVTGEILAVDGGRSIAK